MTPIARCALIVVACLAFMGDASAGGVLVMASTDPALPPGTMVDDALPVKVAAGSEITLLRQDGSMVTLAGPFDDVPPAAAGAVEPDLVAAIADLVGEGGQDTSEFGSVRGAEDGAADPWLIDLSAAGTKCIAATGPVGLWRPEPGGGTFGPVGGGTGVDVAWPEGGGAVPWPDAVARADGGAYALVPVGGGAVPITLKVVPTGMASAAHVARWLAEAGCLAQARLLLGRAAGTHGELMLILGTPRGADPTYRVGEELTLSLDLNADAHVECLYAAADGSVVRLFPNSFTGGPRLAGPFIHTLPRPGDGLALTLSGPPGLEAVHCFGWRHDPGDALPADVANADITAPLARSVGDIEADLFSSSTAPPEAHGELTINVEP